MCECIREYDDVTNKHALRETKIRFPKRKTRLLKPNDGIPEGVFISNIFKTSMRDDHMLYLTTRFPSVHPRMGPLTSAFAPPSLAVGSSPPSGGNPHPRLDSPTCGWPPEFFQSACGWPPAGRRVSKWAGGRVAHP